jgi:hypothetical protein
MCNGITEISCKRLQNWHDAPGKTASSHPLRIQNRNNSVDLACHGRNQARQQTITGTAQLTPPRPRVVANCYSPVEFGAPKIKFSMNQKYIYSKKVVAWNQACYSHSRCDGDWRWSEFWFWHDKEHHFTLHQTLDDTKPWYLDRF